MKLVGHGSLTSLKTRLQQSIKLRVGANDGTGGGTVYRLSSSLPTVITAAIDHRAASRGGCGCCGFTSHRYATGAAAVAADRAGGLGSGNIRDNDGCSGGAGLGQGRTCVMVMLRGNPTVHELIVVLLVRR